MGESKESYVSLHEGKGVKNAQNRPVVPTLKKLAKSIKNIKNPPIAMKIIFIVSLYIYKCHIAHFKFKIE